MENMEQLYAQYSNASSESTENVINSGANAMLQYEQKHNVVLPPDEKMLAVSSSIINKIKTECQVVEKQVFPYAELWLGLATLFLGAFLSALISQTQYELKLLSIFFYSLCPMGGVGFGVAYYFCRKNNVDSLITFSRKINDLLPSYEDEEYN